MDKENIKMLILGIGLILILAYLTAFSISRSPIDLLWISIGLFIFVCGFYRESIYFYLAIFCVNLVQWAILIYICLFNQIYMILDFYFFLVGVAWITIILVKQIYQNRFNAYNNGEKPLSETISSGITWNLKQVFLVILGVLVILGCLISLFMSQLQTEILYALYYCSLGIMMVIYGCYLQINKIQMSLSYFGMMSSIIIFQWMFIFFIVFIEMITRSALSRDVDIIVFITFMISSQFLFQIRRSNMKYLGRYRER